MLNMAEDVACSTLEFAFSFLWASACRGVTADLFTAADIQQFEGIPAFPLQAFLESSSGVMATPLNMIKFCMLSPTALLEEIHGMP